MIVVNAKESKKSVDLAQLLMGTKREENGRFADILALIEGAKIGADKGKNSAFKVPQAEVPQETKVALQPSGASKTKAQEGTLGAFVAPSSPQKASSVGSQPQTLQEQVLWQLLNGAPELVEEGESVTSLNSLLEPKVVTQLSQETLKSTLVQAKQQLRTQIESIIKEQQIEIKTMPQSLKGLVDLAQKLQINVETITLETLQVKHSESLASTLTRLALVTREEHTVTPQLSALRSVLERSAPKDETLQNREDQPLQKLLTGTAQNTKPQQGPSTAMPDAILQRQAVADESVLPSKPDLKTLAPASTQPQTRTNETETAASPVVSPARPTVTAETRSKNALTEEKAHAQPTVTAESQPKSAPLEEVASLLFGEAESVEQTDAPQRPLNVSEQKEGLSAAIPKADALEVKVKEAQQTLRHFATELREAVENYKPPFTRLKITLNPAKLGEVDVTMIQRGNNVHINVSSNSAALNLLAHNVSELKTQLANNGIVNTTMQFSTAHGESQQQAQQGQRDQSFVQSYRSYEALSEEELELITSIEITLPRYA